MEPPLVEKQVGMEVYLTSSPGVGGKLRFFPEDFMVEELSLPPPRVEGGRYVAARVRCRNWETNRLVRELSRVMGISRRRIQFAGTKDKRGVKVQMLTFLASEQQVAAVGLRDFEVLEHYPTDRPLELGHLLGNRFDIRLRGAQAGAAGNGEGAGPQTTSARQGRGRAKLVSAANDQLVVSARKTPGSSRAQKTSTEVFPRKEDRATMAMRSSGSGEQGTGRAEGSGQPGAGTGPADLEAAIGAVTAELDASGGFPNFFGIQRFGALRPVTHIIGERIVRDDFEGAVLAYVGGPNENEETQVREARARIVAERDFAAAVDYYPAHLAFERSLIHHLQLHPGDWTGALRQLPLNLLMMFVHAHQSLLFNRILSRRIREGLPLSEPLEGDVVLPADAHGRPDHDRHIAVEGHNLARVREKVLAGKAFVSGVLFGSETAFAAGRMGEIERAIVAEAGLEPRDFLVPELPEVSSKGTRRELLVRPGNRNITTEADSVLFSFSLPRGCYATALMREYIKGEVLDY